MHFGQSPSGAWLGTGCPQYPHVLGPSVSVCILNSLFARKSGFPPASGPVTHVLKHWPENVTASWGAKDISQFGQFLLHFQGAPHRLRDFLAH